MLLRIQELHLILQSLWIIVYLNVPVDDRVALFHSETFIQDARRLNSNAKTDRSANGCGLAQSGRAFARIMNVKELLANEAIYILQQIGDVSILSVRQTVDMIGKTLETRQMQGIVGRAFARIVNVKELLANEAISCSRLVTCPPYPFCP